MASHFIARFKSRLPTLRLGERAAALAFHFLLAIIPLLALLGVLGSLLIDSRVVEESLIGYARSTLGAQVASLFVDLFTHIEAAHHLIAIPTLGIIIFVFATVNLFALIRRSLFDIFEVPPKRVRRVMVDRVMSFTYSALFGLLLCIMILTQFAVSVVAQAVAQNLSLLKAPLVADIASGFFSFILVFVFFTVTYRIASAGRIRRRYAAAGGLVAATLYVAMTVVLAAVFTYASTAVMYGTVAPVVASILWTYYVSLVLLIGALVAACASFEPMPLPFEREAEALGVQSSDIVKRVVGSTKGRSHAVSLQHRSPRTPVK